MNDQLDIEVVAERLQSGMSNDRYGDLLAVGRAGALQYRPLVESFINCEDDPMLAGLALSILTSHWGVYADFIDDYADDVERFLDGVDWDTDGDVRLMALSAAAYLIEDPKHVKLLKKMVDIYESDREDELDRNHAFGSLAISTGVDRREFLTKAGRAYQREHNSSKVMKTVRERLRAWSK